MANLNVFEHAALRRVAERLPAEVTRRIATDVGNNPYINVAATLPTLFVDEKVYRSLKEILPTFPNARVVYKRFDETMARYITEWNQWWRNSSHSEKEKFLNLIVSKRRILMFNEKLADHFSSLHEDFDKQAHQNKRPHILVAAEIFLQNDLIRAHVPDIMDADTLARAREQDIGPFVPKAEYYAT